jgi:hypothetical protein
MRRATTVAIGTSVVIALAAAVISSSRALGQRSGEPTFSAADSWNRIDVVAAAGATPSPTPCPYCFQPQTANEDFDAVTPPALPPDWLATNAQGPPPLWVSSDSGVPMPAADTPPNALLIDDPAVVSDKRLDGWFVNFFEDCCVRLTFRTTSISERRKWTRMSASTAACWR